MRTRGAWRSTAAAGVALLALTACSSSEQPSTAPTAVSDETVRAPAPDAEEVSSTPRVAPAVQVATFNVLGNSHTERGERGPGWGSGPQRMRDVVSLLDDYRVSLVGFQEFEPIQARAFLRLRGESWELAHDSGDPGNSLAWDEDVWRAMQTRLLPIPYFNGRVRRIPVVLLERVNGGGRLWVINAHNPANTKRFPHQERWRRGALRRELALVRHLHSSTDVPVVLLGDLNDREAAFCPLARAGLQASAGGSVSGSTCDPPDPTPIDWIFSTQDVRFTEHVRDLAPIRLKISDHPIAVTSIQTSPAS